MPRRRLALLCFPFTFRKPGEPLHSNNDRVGDPTLKARIRRGVDGRHDAIVTWAVEGAIRWYADPATSLLPTAKIKADTRAWRADADRILGFWDERLIGDRDACIITTEMLDEFNRWLKSNGHNEWSKELFGPRFVQHGETVRHGVEGKRTTQLEGLSRPAMAFSDVPPRAYVYQGVRFQTASDKEKHEDCPSCPTSSETFSYTRNSESFPKGRAGRAEEPSGSAKPCDFWADGAYCGEPNTRRFMKGWRCVRHAPDQAART